MFCIIFCNNNNILYHIWFHVKFEHDIQNSKFISEAKYFFKTFTENFIKYCPRRANFLQI